MRTKVLWGSGGSGGDRAGSTSPTRASRRTTGGSRGRHRRGQAIPGRADRGVGREAGRSGRAGVPAKRPVRQADEGRDGRKALTTRTSSRRWPRPRCKAFLADSASRDAALGSGARRARSTQAVSGADAIRLATDSAAAAAVDAAHEGRRRREGARPGGRQGGRERFREGARRRVGQGARQRPRQGDPGRGAREARRATSTSGRVVRTDSTSRKALTDEDLVKASDRRRASPRR